MRGTVAEKFLMHAVECCFIGAVWNSKVESKH
jgi:hypothetical protein